MDAKVFWVGEKPGGSALITLLNEDGTPVPVNTFSTIRVRMLDSDNNEVYIEPGRTSVYDETTGKVAFQWPTDRSLFEEAGEYVLQVELSTPSATRFSTVQNIIVKEFGGV